MSKENFTDFGIGGNNTTINGLNGARKFGGTMVSSLTVQEIA